MYIVAILKVSLIILKLWYSEENVKAHPRFDFKSSEISGAGIIVYIPFGREYSYRSSRYFSTIDRGIIGRNTFKFIIAVEFTHGRSRNRGALLTLYCDNTFGFESF